MKNFVNTSRRKQLLCMFQIRKTFPYVDINFRRDYMTGTSVYNINVYEIFQKTQKREFLINRGNYWSALSQVHTNLRVKYNNNVGFQTYVTKRNELKKKETDELAKLKECKEKKKIRKTKNENKKVNISAESATLQKKERNEYPSYNVSNKLSLKKVQEQFSKDETNKSINSVSNLKKNICRETNYTKKEENSYEQTSKRNTVATCRNNTKTGNEQLKLHLEHKSSTNIATDVDNTLFLKNKDQRNNTNCVTNVQLDSITKNTKHSALHVMDNKKFNLERKLQNIELLNYYVTKIKILINNVFEKYLLLMNCVIAGTFYFIADTACQFLENKKETKNYDFSRTLRMSFIGISLEGPIMTWWYGKILAQFVKSKPNTFLYKSFLPALFDNFIFGPIHLTIFFSYNGILTRQSREEIKEKICNTGLNVFLVSLLTWTPLSLINFFFVRRVYQAAVVFLADFFWIIFLSWCVNKKG